MVPAHCCFPQQPPAALNNIQADINFLLSSKQISNLFQQMTFLDGGQVQHTKSTSEPGHKAIMGHTFSWSTPRHPSHRLS